MQGMWFKLFLLWSGGRDLTSSRCPQETFPSFHATGGFSRCLSLKLCRLGEAAVPLCIQWPHLHVSYTHFKAFKKASRCDILKNNMCFWGKYTCASTKWVLRCFDSHHSKNGICLTFCAVPRQCSNYPAGLKLKDAEHALKHGKHTGRWKLNAKKTIWAIKTQVQV